VGEPEAGSTTGAGLAVSPGGSTPDLVDVQPNTNRKNPAIHPNTIAERTLLAVLTNMAPTSFTLVGNSADSPAPLLSRHLPLTIMPKCSTYEIRIWAIMLKNFRISSPNGR
jgi:hypothetical protein